MNVEQTIRNYITDILHMSLATSRANKPWITEVHFWYDDDLTIYFRSTVARRHSQEIADNPSVSGNIVRQHGLTDKPRGVYFEGKAEMLTNVYEKHMAYITFAQRFGERPAIIEEARTETGAQFYRVNIETLYLFDAVESKPAQKYVWNLGHEGQPG